MKTPEQLIADENQWIRDYEATLGPNELYRNCVTHMEKILAPGEYGPPEFHRKAWDETRGVQS